MKFNILDLKNFAKDCFNKFGKEQIEDMKYSISRTMRDMVKGNDKPNDYDKQEDNER